MSLKQKLQQDLNSALKAHEDLKRLVLSSLVASIHNKEIEKRTAKAKETPGSSAEDLEKALELTDEEITKTIQSEIKKRKEAIELYEKGGREELAKKEKDEINILLEYAPKQLSEDKLKKIIEETITETGAPVPSASGEATGQAKEMGKIIRLVMERVKGQADGGEVSKIVKEKLSK